MDHFKWTILSKNQMIIWSYKDRHLMRNRPELLRSNFLRNRLSTSGLKGEHICLKSMLIFQGFHLKNGCALTPIGLKTAKIPFQWNHWLLKSDLTILKFFYKAQIKYFRGIVDAIVGFGSLCGLYPANGWHQNIKRGEWCGIILTWVGAWNLSYSETNLRFQPPHWDFLLTIAGPTQAR